MPPKTAVRVVDRRQKAPIRLPSGNRVALVKLGRITSPIDDEGEGYSAVMLRYARAAGQDNSTV